jgi:hypothetical protein
MELHSMEKIVRTGGSVAAAKGRTGDGFEHRIENPLVKADRKVDQGAEEA